MIRTRIFSIFFGGGKRTPHTRRSQCDFFPSFVVVYTPRKTNMTINHPPFEVVFPIEHGDFPMSCLVFRGVCLPSNKLPMKTAQIPGILSPSTVDAEVFEECLVTLGADLVQFLSSWPVNLPPCKVPPMTNSRH